MFQKLLTVLATALVTSSAFASSLALADSAADVAPEAFAPVGKTVLLTSTTGESLRVHWVPSVQQGRGFINVSAKEFMIELEDLNVETTSKYVYAMHACYVAGTNDIIDGKTFDVRYTSDTPGSNRLVSSRDSRHQPFLLSYADADRAVECATEFSISIDGNWLIDPINGTPFFKVFH